MRIGLITVRDADYHPNRRLLEAGRAQGHDVVLVHPYRFSPSLEGGAAGLAGQPALDVVLPRQGATVGEGCLPLIRHFELMGIPVLNNLPAILLARNKMLSLQAVAAAGLTVPDGAFINAAEQFPPVVERLGGFPVVVKSVTGRQGEGVILAESGRDMRRMQDAFGAAGRGLLVQRFIPPEGRHDVRVLVLGGQTVGAMALKPQAGDFRANFHLSGVSRPVTLTRDLEATAIHAASAVGLEIAGVDLIVAPGGGAYVVEVNYSPGFRGLEQATGLDIAARLIAFTARRAAGAGP